MSTKKIERNWNKKEPIMCHNEHICGNKAVAENGDGYWYCFSCFQDMYNDAEEIEIDESLEVCQTELARQSQ